MPSTHDFYPKRIICLTAECTETLYLLGESDRIVGISGFCNRPEGVRKEKPIVSTFLEAKKEKILDLKPDLVIGYSDLQATIAQELIKAGISVWINNHRSVQGILSMVMQLGSMVGQSEKAYTLIQKIQQCITDIQARTNRWAKKPKVYFEEWDEPMISGIEWVGEIISLAGGQDIFPEHAALPLASQRIISDPNEVVRRDPDIILAAWCGKKFKEDRLLNRSGWSEIQAVSNAQLFEIDSDLILQPGPVALLEALPHIHHIIQNWQEKHG
ncbi:MAG: cobalamin-binding protein [Bacteroidota bacterium]